MTCRAGKHGCAFWARLPENQVENGNSVHNSSVFLEAVPSPMQTRSMAEGSGSFDLDPSGRGSDGSRSSPRVSLEMSVSDGYDSSQYILSTNREDDSHASTGRHRLSAHASADHIHAAVMTNDNSNFCDPENGSSAEKISAEVGLLEGP